MNALRPVPPRVTAEVRLASGHVLHAVDVTGFVAAMTDTGVATAVECVGHLDVRGPGAPPYWVDMIAPWFAQNPAAAEAIGDEAFEMSLAPEQTMGWLLGHRFGALVDAMIDNLTWQRESARRTWYPEPPGWHSKPLDHLAAPWGSHQAWLEADPFVEAHLHHLDAAVMGLVNGLCPGSPADMASLHPENWVGVGSLLYCPDGLGVTRMPVDRALAYIAAGITDAEEAATLESQGTPAATLTSMAALTRRTDAAATGWAG